MPNRWIQSLIVTGGLAAAIHLDWHVARHGDHLSLGWSYHWLLAIPVFAAAAIHTALSWPQQVMRASVSVLAGAVVLGQVVEPLIEVALLGASVQGVLSGDRMVAFGAFTGIGILAFVAAAWSTRRRQPNSCEGPT